MRLGRLSLIWLMCLVPCTSFATPDREAALFGAPEESPDAKADPMESAASPPSKTVIAPQSDPLEIGGRLYLRTQTFAFDDQEASDLPLDHSALVYLYGDARPTSRLRAFLKTRIDHRFTQTASAFTQGADGPGGDGANTTNVQLDQLWLKFDLGRTVFVTFGQQPVRWGTTRIWNPVDFVNAQRKDPLAIFDARPGIPMLKLHMPIEGLGDGANIYAIAQLDDAETLTDVGGLLRAEVTYGATETGLSFAARSEQPIRLGMDFSGGIGPLELRLEGAVSHGGDQHTWSGPLVIDPQAPEFPTRVDRSDDWIPKATAGIEWGIPYGDEDTLYLTLEYFYNDAGYTDEALYPWLVTQGEYAPLYLGRHYVGAGLVIPRPGGWNDTTFLMTGISNLSDGTHIARADYQVRVLTRLSLYCFVSSHFGEGGEFRFELDIPPVPGVPELEQGLSIEPMRFNAGVWLSLDL